MLRRVAGAHRYGPRGLHVPRTSLTVESACAMVRVNRTCATIFTSMVRSNRRRQILRAFAALFLYSFMPIVGPSMYTGAMSTLRIGCRRALLLAHLRVAGTLVVACGEGSIDD